MIQRKNISLFDIQQLKDLLESHANYLPTGLHVFVDRASAGDEDVDDGDVCDEQSEENSKVSCGRIHCTALGEVWEDSAM